MIVMLTEEMDMGLVSEDVSCYWTLAGHDVVDVRHGPPLQPDTIPLLSRCSLYQALRKNLAAVVP